MKRGIKLSTKTSFHLTLSGIRDNTLTQRQRTCITVQEIIHQLLGFQHSFHQKKNLNKQYRRRRRRRKRNLYKKNTLAKLYVGTFQTIAQNFFLQINTISAFFSIFSSKCDSTSHKNFGARSWILDVMVSSSLMIINPCTLTQHNSESYATSNRKKLQEIYFGGPTKQKEILLNGLKLSTIGFEHQVLNHL